jgi:acetyl-CoA carboxylase carboxyltransferase component
VAELIALGMVTSVGNIESEMGYHAANPFTAHNLSLFYLFMMKLLQLKALLKRVGEVNHFSPGY